MFTKEDLINLEKVRLMSHIQNLRTATKAIDDLKAQQRSVNEQIDLACDQQRQVLCQATVEAKDQVQRLRDLLGEQGVKEYVDSLDADDVMLSLGTTSTADAEAKMRKTLASLKTAKSS